MNTSQVKKQKRDRRHGRIRAKVVGTSDRPRLCVFRSNTGVYAQLIDDATGRTVVAVDSRKETDAGLRARARKVGQHVAKLAREKGIERVVFDRGGFLYAGSIKEVAEGAREGGLTF